MFVRRSVLAIALVFATLSGAESAILSDGPADIAAPSPFQVAELAAQRRVAADKVQLGVFSDNGLVIEFAVSCGVDSGMLTYSRSDRLFCNAGMRCSTSRGAVIATICRD